MWLFALNPRKIRGYKSTLRGYKPEFLEVLEKRKFSEYFQVLLYPRKRLENRENYFKSTYNLQ